MFRVKEFDVYVYFSSESYTIDQKINMFLKENKCKLIDVKYQCLGLKETKALLIYETNEAGNNDR